MFAYCNNNPINCVDHTGMMATVYPVMFDYEPPRRDVTEEVNAALIEKSREARIVHGLVNTVGLGCIFAKLAIYIEFYNLVNHGAPWDIKLEVPWENTIGTLYPGKNAWVVFDGKAMTIDKLGNYTYGFLGYSYGIPLPMLIAGSYYAAGFPTSGERARDEAIDWLYIAWGYLEAHVQY